MAADCGDALGLSSADPPGGNPSVHWGQKDTSLCRRHPM